MVSFTQTQAESHASKAPKRNRRSKRRQLFCPAHPDQRIEGNGRKYYLHLLQPEQLQQRGIPAKRAKLIINAYPVLVLSNEWLEELYCPECGSLHWCHITKHNALEHSVCWAEKELWEQVAHVDPIVANPTVSEFSRREARRTRQKRADGRHHYERK